MSSVGDVLAMSLRGARNTVGAMGRPEPRISLGSGLMRAALGEFARAAREVREHGTFTFSSRAMAYRDLNTLFAD